MYRYSIIIVADVNFLLIPYGKKDILNTTTRAHVRHAHHSPPFSIQRLLSRRGGEMSLLSILVLSDFIIYHCSLCSLYINNTGSIRSRRMCFCSFFRLFEVICVSYNFIFDYIIIVIIIIKIIDGSVCISLLC